MAEALSAPYLFARLSRHWSSVGREDIWFASSLTEPTSIGMFFEISGARTKKDRRVMTRWSTHGVHPTRGVPGPPSDSTLPCGLIRAAAASPAATSLRHCILLLLGRDVPTAARLHRHAMEQPHGRRHAHQGRYFRAAARLTIDHYPVGIATEVCDVLLNPLQRRHQIRHPHID